MMRDHYTYRVTWSVEDGAHVGTCLEFPSLSWIADTPAAALEGIRQLVSGVLNDLDASGEAAPQPFADRAYSGKFMVRVPPEMHRRLIMQAAEEGVSLNRLVSSRLSV
jgi:predicted HicB family RNase H-like nuclease